MLASNPDSVTLSSFAENGYRVFLVNHMEKNEYTGRLSCGCGKHNCTAVGKHPVSENWPKTPEWDEDQIETFQYAVNQGRGYGVICNNLLVIDVDARNGGVRSYEKLVERFPTVAACGLIVQTGSGEGSSHRYFSLPPEVKISQSHPDFPGVDFKHSGFVIGPGSPHASGKRYTVLHGSVEDIDEAPEDLVEFLRRKTIKVEHEGREMEISDYALKTMLEAIPNTAGTEYHEWLEVGMALHHATHGDGIDLFRAWSSKSPKHNDETLDFKWHSFGKNGGPAVTVGTLIHHAKDNGWVEPITDGDEPELQGWFAKALTGNPVTSSVTQEDINEAKNAIKGCPVDVSRIDLTKPPGFVGEVTDWINSQCEYPRENLAAMAALFAVGNAAGLHHMEDSGHETRSNLAVLCVAGSGTGKDKVLHAVKEIHNAAGLSPCDHGNFKSDREVYMNLLEHQAAIYTVDEIGARLAKITNASKGGAAHLEGTMETFMDIYTKSATNVLMTGDMKKETDKFLRDRYAQLKQIVENNEDKSGAAEAEMASIERRRAMQGRLEKPFLSLIGFTTPRQFAKIMTVENVETGFLGRTIFVSESDINPYPKPFQKTDLPPSMKMRIQQLSNGGKMDTTGYVRVECNGHVERIGHSAAAKELLQKCKEWSWHYTQGQIELRGDAFAGLYRRLYEKVVKIALVLGVADGEIDVEHVQWAMAASLRDVEEKISAVTIEDQSFTKAERLAAAIQGALKSKPGATLAQVHNRSNIRSKYNKDDVETMLKKMAEGGIIRVEDGTDGRSGLPLKRYCLMK